MESYTLYLDEILPLDTLKYFCLAGVLVNEKTYSSEIIGAVNQIKNDIFADTTVILHELELWKRKKGSPYLKLNKEKRTTYISKVVDLFKNHNFHVLGVGIHQADLERLYPNLRDKYFISLQMIMENFANFLERHDGIGNIIIESRNPKQDQQLRSHFYNLKATGTLFYEPSLLQKHLGGISFPIKQENVIGLQIADMIPNSLNRDLSGIPQKMTGLIDQIYKKSYDGLIGEHNRFGIKLIP